MSVSSIEVALPSGRLSLSEDGRASVLLRLSIRNREALLAAVDSTSGLAAGRFWPGGARREDDEGLHLTYAKPWGVVTPLTRLVGLWRAEPAVALVRALELARHLLHVTGELEQLQPSRFPLSPAQVFAVKGEDGKENWLVLPLPLERTAFADFIRADEDYWAWLSADEMFGASRPDRAYMTGAALYYCLVAPLFPAEVSRAERVRRLVLYRAGNPHLLRAALAGALPDSESKAAVRLADFIAGLLAPPLGRALTAAQALRDLDHFCGELSPHRLACSWEVAGDDRRCVQRAHAIIETLVATAPDSEVPWEAVERLREKVGDRAGAADAAARRSRPPEESSVITYVRSLLDAGEQRRPELERLIEMVREVATGTGAAAPSQERGVIHADAAPEPKPGQYHLSEEEYLYLTYVHGRWMGQADEALLWLRRDFSISWNKVMRWLLAARFAAGKEEWVRTAAHCRDGRRQVEQMSNAGGAYGRYANAYLDLLDGIAHVCAVHRQQHASDYLSTAFDRLRKAWEGMREVGATDDEALMDWLSLLAGLAGRDPRLAMLRLGVEAFLESRGVGPGPVAADGSPPIPWFDEYRVFTSLSTGETT